jgi:hydrogenase maturation protease
LTRNVTGNKAKEKKKILVYGIGNPGRQDDALGILLIEKLDVWVKDNGIDYIQTDQNYQLNIEDADRIAGFDVVIFVDASVQEIDAILLEEIKPDLTTDFSMHSVEPAFVVGLCYQIFNRHPISYQLHVKGVSFGFMEPMTHEATKNLELAFQELIKIINSLSEI